MEEEEMPEQAFMVATLFNPDNDLPRSVEYNDLFDLDDTALEGEFQ